MGAVVRLGASSNEPPPLRRWFAVVGSIYLGPIP